MSKTSNNGGNDRNSSKDSKPLSKNAQKALKAGQVISAVGVATSGASKGISMIPGAKSKAVGLVGSAAGRVIKFTGDVIQKVANSNDPKWYTYDGKLAKLATNDLRPFSPEDLINSGAVAGDNAYTMGVPHVITTNLQECPEFFHSEAFNLVTNQMYSDIRMTLRSNLAYTVDDLRDYLRGAISIAPIVAQIAKHLRMYDVTRPDMPELQTSFRSLASSDNEYGIVRPIGISFMSDNNYPASINAAEKLTVLLRQLPVPIAWSQYVNWLFGTIFTDQHAPNPQLYHNMLRVAYVYGANGQITSSYDLSTLTISDVYSVTEQLFTRYGTIIADIKKHLVANDQHYCTLDKLFDFAGSQIISEDYEYFNYLINGYTCDETGISVMGDFGVDGEYARIDTMAQLTDRESVGATLAIAKAAGAIVPFTIVSQNAYYRAGVGTRVPNNYSLTWNPGSASASQTSGNYSGSLTRDCYYQYSSKLLSKDVVDIYASQSTAQINATPTNKLAQNSGYVFTNGSLTTYRQFNFTVKVPYGATENVARDISDPGVIGYNGTMLYYIKAKLSDQLELTAIQIVARDLSSGTETVLGALAISGSGISVTRSVELAVGRPVAEVFQYTYKNQVGIQLTGLGSNVAKVVPLFTIGSTIYQNCPLAQLSGSASLAAYSWQVSVMNIYNVAQFVEDVDYHIPVKVYGKRTITQHLNDGITHRFMVDEMPLLLKETYIPQIVSMENVRSVTYWMMVGLLSKF